MKKVINFQIVQGHSSRGVTSWYPDVVALCEDGSLWIISIAEFQDGKGDNKDWKRLTPELAIPSPSFMATPNVPF